MDGLLGGVASERGKYGPEATGRPFRGCVPRHEINETVGSSLFTEARPSGSSKNINIITLNPSHPLKISIILVAMELCD